MPVSPAALDSLLERLQRDGVAYHYAPVSMSRRESFKESTGVALLLEKALGVPVNFDRLDHNQFELWV